MGNKAKGGKKVGKTPKKVGTTKPAVEESDEEETTDEETEDEESEESEESEDESDEDESDDADADESDEDESEEAGGVTVKFRDHQGKPTARTFTKKAHGKEFKALAGEFKEKMTKQKRLLK